MPRPRAESHIIRSRGFIAPSDSIAPIPGNSSFGSPVRENVIPTSIASTVPDSDDRSASKGGVSTAVVIQLLFLALFVVGIATFVVQRRRRYKRRLQHQQQARHIRHISAPNGLDPGPSGNIPPSYQEALKSPVITASSVSASSHQRQRSDEALMDQCWAAVYQVEDGGIPGPNTHSTASNERSEPTTPRAGLRSDQRQSVSVWLRNHLRGTGSDSGSGPLSSNPPRAASSANLPVPPSPSYTGIPATPTASVPQTPMSSTNLAPLYSPYPEPLSARSWATGEDRLSLRASIPNSVLYPSPLQPAPPSRRLSQTRRDRESISSVEAYGAETWRTITPHEDPPEYEPRRGNPDNVSPV